MLDQYRTHITVGLFGSLLGFSLGMIGFRDFGELNRMFTFQDLRMFLSFAVGVALAAVGFLVFTQDRPKATKIHRGVVPGAVLFGTGWAISGGCPSIPLVQLGTGYLPALATMAGIVVGMRTYRILNARYFRFDSGACSI